MKTVATLPLLSFLMLLTMVSRSSVADDKTSSYSVVCVAKKAGTQILVKCAIIKASAEGKPQVISRPYVQMSDGRSAELTIGQDGDSGAGANTATQPGEPAPFSGLHITVVKAMGSDKVEYMVTVMENDAIIWAQTGSATVETVSGPATRSSN